MQIRVNTGTTSNRVRAAALLLISVGLFGDVCVPAPSRAQQADLIVTNGKIVSVDAGDGIYEAMAIREGRILHLGTGGDVQALAGPDTEVLDLQGRTVLPGLIDSHTHAAEAAVAEFDHEIPDMRSIDDVLDYVSTRAQAAGPDEWVVVQQVFLTRLQERRNPTRAELDGAAPNNPVLFRTGSEAVLNTPGLARFGIDRSFEAPAGSEVETDAETGEPTGVVRGWKAIFSIPETGQSPDVADQREWLRRLIADYNQTGITTFADRRAYANQAAIYEALEKSGDLTARVAIYRYIDTSVSADSISSQIREIGRDPLTRQPALARIVGVKTYADGGMLSGTAFMLDPWGTSEMYGITDPHYHGLPLIGREKLLALAGTAIKEGLQPTVHAVGDGAVDLVVQAYQSLADSLPTVPFQQVRPCVTHANFIADRTIEAMASYGIVADVQPVWLHSDAAVLESHFGYERMASFQPLRTLFDRRVVIGGGSDHMKKIGPFRSINPYSPFLGMETVITRRARDYASQLHPEEAITRMEAVRMYTINNAFLLRMDEETGSLEAGKEADFIVLDRDILSIPEEDISEVQVVETYLAGRSVYRRDG